MKITSRFLDVTRRAIRIEHTMSSDYCLGMKGFNFLERQKPLAASFFIALGEIQMRVVIDAISRYNEVNGGHIQRS